MKNFVLALIIGSLLFLSGCFEAGLLVGKTVVEHGGGAIAKSLDEKNAAEARKTTKINIPEFTPKTIEKGPYKIIVENMWREKGERLDYVCFDITVTNIGQKDFFIHGRDFSCVLDSGRFAIFFGRENVDEIYFDSSKNKVGSMLFPGVSKKGIIKMAIFNKQDNPKRLTIWLAGEQMKVDLP